MEVSWFLCRSPENSRKKYRDANSFIFDLARSCCDLCNDNVPFIIDVTTAELRRCTFRAGTTRGAKKLFKFWRKMVRFVSCASVPSNRCSMCVVNSSSRCISAGAYGATVP